ncbi:hypothetical protein M2164_006549 [Streptomyces sp. SAI-208]|nr:hypothetical protein [Streptomyces sp. SAI-208]
MTLRRISGTCAQAAPGTAGDRHEHPVGHGTAPGRTGVRGPCLAESGHDLGFPASAAGPAVAFGGVRAVSGRTGEVSARWGVRARAGAADVGRVVVTADVGPMPFRRAGTAECGKEVTAK